MTNETPTLTPITKLHYAGGMEFRSAVVERIKREVPDAQGPNVLVRDAKRRARTLSALAERIEGLAESDPRLHALWQVQIASHGKMGEWTPNADQQLLLALLGQEEDDLEVSTDDALAELTAVGVAGVGGAQEARINAAFESRVQEEMARQVEPLQEQVAKAESEAGQLSAQVAQLERERADLKERAEFLTVQLEARGQVKQRQKRVRERIAEVRKREDEKTKVRPKTDAKPAPDKPDSGKPEGKQTTKGKRSRNRKRSTNQAKVKT